VNAPAKAAPPILFCGDAHGKFGHILEAAKAFPSSPVVLLGDLELLRSMDEEFEDVAARLWFIHGNHDADSPELWERIVDSRLAARNVHGRVMKLPGGTRLAGLGGIFRSSIWYPHPTPQVNVAPRFRSLKDHARATPQQARWRDGPHLKNHASIYPSDVARLSALRADVLVTHEAPGYHAYGFECLNVLARALGVRFAVHGHQHDCIDSSTKWEAQGFRTFGVGLRGVTAIDSLGNAEVVVVGEKDHLSPRIC